MEKYFDVIILQSNLNLSKNRNVAALVLDFCCWM
jgi:hypothetical protein